LPYFFHTSIVGCVDSVGIDSVGSVDPLENIDLKCLVVQLVADQKLEGGALDPDLQQQARPSERAKAQ
jgi:hypothetical protein